MSEGGARSSIVNYDDEDMTTATAIKRAFT